MAFMSLAFVSKQLDHAAAVLRLREHPDTNLVVRSMLEGLCQIKWALAEPQERAHRWRAFAYVTDWRLARKRHAASLPNADRDLRDCEREVLLHGRPFLTKRARSALESTGQLPTDPYVDNWTGKSVRELFEAVKATDHYEWTYGIYSAWHHWSPGAIGLALKRTKRGVRYSPRDRATTVVPLIVAFQCLLEVAQVADETAGLGIAHNLSLRYRSFMRLAERDQQARRNAPRV